MSESITKFKGSVANLLLRFLVFGVYVALGMVIIVAIEKTDNDESKRKLALLSELQLNITAKYNLSKKEFEFLANTIYNAKSPSRIKWTYTNGLSFIIQLVTTIGFGNITPVTSEGKVFCMIYALFGIPITVLILSTVGREMLNLEKFIIKIIETKLLKRQNVQHIDLKCLLAAFATTVVLMLVGAIFSEKNHEDWTYLDSVYCWFITFTTVGFGDFIPGEGLLRGNAVRFSIYTLIGLCAMSNLINIMGNIASRGAFEIKFKGSNDRKVESDRKCTEI